MIIGIVLAAGQGKRMQSALPKVLHRVNGREMIRRIVDEFLRMGTLDRIIIVVNPDNARDIRDCVGDIPSVDYAIQTHPRGTGDAVRCALASIGSCHGTVLVGCGDTPLVHHHVLIDLHRRLGDDDRAFGVVVYERSDPTGYGRVLVDEEQGTVHIVEEKDCDDAARQVRLVNGGLYAFPIHALQRAVSRISPNNKSNEYYLPDVFVPLQEDGMVCRLMNLPSRSLFVLEGVNTMEQLQHLDNIFTTPVRLLQDVEGEGVSWQDIQHFLSMHGFFADATDGRMNDMIMMHPMIQIFVLYHPLPGLIGMATLWLEPKLIHNNGIVGHIEDMMIHPYLRQHGLGTRLVRHLVETAKSVGCYKVILNSKPNNDAFYRSLGFVSSQSQYEIRLDPTA